MTETPVNTTCIYYIHMYYDSNLYSPVYYRRFKEVHGYCLEWRTNHSSELRWMRFHCTQDVKFSENVDFKLIQSQIVLLQSKKMIIFTIKIFFYY